MDNNDGTRNPFAPYENQTEKELALRSKRPSLKSGLAWCVLGSLGCLWFSWIGVFVTSYGLTIASFGEDKHKSAIAHTVALAPLLGLTLASSPYLGCELVLAGIFGAMIYCISAKQYLNHFSKLFALALVATFAVAAISHDLALLGALIAFSIAVAVTDFSLHGKTTQNFELLCVTAGGIGLIGLEVFGAYLANTDVQSALTWMFDATAKMYASSLSVSQQAEFTYAKEIYLLYWPVFCFLVAAILKIIARQGVVQGIKRFDLIAVVKPFRYFETPLWVIGVLIAGLALLIVGKTYFEGSGLLTMIALDIIVLARIIFTLQGLAVVDYYLGVIGFPKIIIIPILVILASFELTFASISIVGLVDVFANIRRLPKD